MKKSSFKRPASKKKKVKKILFLLLFILGSVITYQYLDKSSIEIDNKELVEVLLSNTKETTTLKK